MPTKFNNPCFVALYHVDQAYGGPEEGGWWYYTGQRLRTPKAFPNEDSAQAYAQRYNRRLSYLQRDDPDMHQTNGRGFIGAEVWSEEYPPEGFPERRPHYE